MNLAREKYKPFEPFMVDSYSANALQAQTHVSGGKIQREDEITSRVKAYRRHVKENGTPSMLALDSSFSVTVVQDSFSGPERMNRNANCDWLPDFKVEAKWS